MLTLVRLIKTALYIFFFSNNRCQPKRLIWQLIWPFSLPQQRSAAHSDGPSAKASPRILAGPMQYSYRSSLGATTPLQELVYRADRHLRSGSSAATIWVGLAGGFPGCFSGVICIINNHQWPASIGKRAALGGCYLFEQGYKCLV